MADAIEDRARFDLVRYANCWEDADILCEALRPGPGKRVLSIASGGDNALALAAEGAEVVAADLSLAQLACVELKCAAFRRLDYEDLLAFLGVRLAADRLATFARVENELSPEARAFWQARSDDVGRGIVHAGKFERYFKLFRSRVMPLIHRTRAVEQLLEDRDEAARRAFYDQHWNNWRWRMLFRVFFSRFVMGRMGRDPEFFRYVEGSVSDRILSRTRYALTALPTHSNPYLRYILTGTFDRALPRYLRLEHFDAVRAGVDRITFFHGSIQDAAASQAGDGFDGFNLSDVFEYLDPEAGHAIYAALLASARPASRLAYWNMLVPRRCPGELSSRVRSLDALAQRLFERDLAFFYSAFVVEEVR